MNDVSGDASMHASGALYLLGALDPVQEAAFERHLLSCPACRRECEEVGPLASGLSLLPDGEVAALLRDGPADGQGPGTGATP